MPRTAAASRAPAPAVEEIVDAARADVAEHARHHRSACLLLVRWLATLEQRRSPARLRDNAAAVRARVLVLERGRARGFWPLLCLAAIEEQSGEHAAMVRVLERALDAAVDDAVPAQTVLHARGYLGHALEADGRLSQARATFEALLGDAHEGPHATAHLGRIALRTEGIAIAVETWLAHPAGLASGAALIAREADRLWHAEPERSYRVVARALERLDALAPAPASDVTAARMRLLARTRENAMPAAR